MRDENIIALFTLLLDRLSAAEGKLAEAESRAEYFREQHAEVARQLAEQP